MDERFDEIITVKSVKHEETKTRNQYVMVVVGFLQRTAGKERTVASPHPLR